MSARKSELPPIRDIAEDLREGADFDALCSRYDVTTGTLTNRLAYAGYGTDGHPKHAEAARHPLVAGVEGNAMTGIGGGDYTGLPLEAGAAYAAAQGVPWFGLVDVAGVGADVEGSLMAFPLLEPDRACLLIDRENDIWRYEQNAWNCQTESATGTWEHISKYFGPLQVFLPQSDDGAGASPAASAETRTPSAQADQDGRTPAPSSPRTFELVRHHDVSGQTGTGVVAEGVQFTDLTAALRWRGGHPATAVWPNVEEILAVHGHEGATELRWLDLPETMFRSTDLDLKEDEHLERVRFVPIEDDDDSPEWTI